MGLPHVVQERPVAGDHVYVAAPLALSTVDEPAQIATLLPALTPDNGLTVTVTVDTAVHPAVVPATV